MLCSFSHGPLGMSNGFAAASRTACSMLDYAVTEWAPEKPYKESFQHNQFNPFFGGLSKDNYQKAEHERNKNPKEMLRLKKEHPYW